MPVVPAFTRTAMTRLRAKGTRRMPEPAVLKSQVGQADGTLQERHRHLPGRLLQPRQRLDAAGIRWGQPRLRQRRLSHDAQAARHLRCRRKPEAGESHGRPGRSGCRQVLRAGRQRLRDNVPRHRHRQLLRIGHYQPGQLRHLQAEGGQLAEPGRRRPKPRDPAGQRFQPRPGRLRREHPGALCQRAEAGGGPGYRLPRWGRRPDGRLL